MVFKQRLIQKQVQKMIMSQKMQQSMHILQLPILELNQLIAQEIATNPVLEEIAVVPEGVESGPRLDLKDDKQLIRQMEWLDNDNVWSADFLDRSRIAEAGEKKDFQQSLISRSVSLQEELIQQFRLANEDEALFPTAEQIIGNIDENGYLTVPCSEIAAFLDCPIEHIETVLEMIQQLDPAGVGARDLQECLLIQLLRQGRGADSPEAAIVSGHIDNLARKRFNRIAKALGLSPSQVKKYAERIGRLDPKPCRGFATAAVRIVPDLILEKNGEKFEIIVNSRTLPRLSISRMYKKMLKDKSCSEEALTFIREKLKNAQYLISGLSQRQYTLQRVGQCIMEFQTEFVNTGSFNLKPITLRDIAEKLELHPSTISRTVAGKYIQTPHGTHALKSFFSQAVASETGDDISNQKVKSVIMEMIKTEPEDSPLSDQKIVFLLKNSGMNISRRTVTKYRNSLRIPPAHLRRK